MGWSMYVFITRWEYLGSWDCEYTLRDRLYRADTTTDSSCDEKET